RPRQCQYGNTDVVKEMSDFPNPLASHVAPPLCGNAPRRSVPCLGFALCPPEGTPVPKLVPIPVYEIEAAKSSVLGPAACGQVQG
ncbi:MAG: hypothetical protein ACK2T0_07070, partial [Anaerolineales bacterium]